MSKRRKDRLDCPAIPGRDGNAVAACRFDGEDGVGVTTLDTLVDVAFRNSPGFIGALATPCSDGDFHSVANLAAAGELMGVVVVVGGGGGGGGVSSLIVTGDAGVCREPALCIGRLDSGESLSLSSRR